MAEEQPPVRVEGDAAGVLSVTLDRPQRRNALDDACFDLLEDAYTRQARDPSVRCVVLRGAGPGFCAGLDRDLLASLAGRTPEAIRRHGGRVQAVIDAIEACPRPTLAVVQGACVGGGVALLLACDLRVAAVDAFFSVMEMRYGFLPDLGHVHRLQRELGPTRLKEWLFFGDRLDAATLGRWGVLNEVVAPEELEAAAQRWARRLATRTAPLAAAELKRLLIDHPGGVEGAASQDQALAVNADRLLRSADFAEGVASALEGRPPRFSGR